jgi:hypothetical protein
MSVTIPTTSLSSGSHILGMRIRRSGQQLGQTANISVQNAAIVNAGDIFIATIITLPHKGTATVSSGGGILYTPDATVGEDTVRFQLRNQCGRCSAGNLFITIQNNAPVIIPDPVVVTTGETVSMNLLSIVSDPNNNLDPSSLRITQQPTSGAQASVDASLISSLTTPVLCSLVPTSLL